jgi:molybdopterin/thiamine biosynthesis adenylyltransferase
MDSADMLLAALERAATTGTLPDGSPVRVVPHGAVDGAARQTGMPLRQAEIAALELGLVPERYLRNFATLDCAAQARLLRARVALVGLGGLGGHILEGLARMGVGQIRVADHDVFEPTNLNRQLLATEAELGVPKTDAAVRRVALVNPAVELEVWRGKLEGQDFVRLWTDADVAVDALGGVAFRPAAEAGAAAAGVPLIAASVAGWTAMVATALPGERGLAGMFFPHGQSAAPPAEDVLGCQPPALLVAAGLALSEAVRLILGQPPRLGGPHGRMAVVDLSSVTLDRLSLQG